MKPTKTENILFASCMVLTIISILLLTAYNNSERNKTELINLMQGMEMPYEVFDGLNPVQKQIFINNGGKVLPTKK